MKSKNMVSIMVAVDADIEKAKKSTEYAKAVLSHLIESSIQNEAFKDLTDTAIRDVLIDRLKTWNYKKK